MRILTLLSVLLLVPAGSVLATEPVTTHRGAYAAELPDLPEGIASFGAAVAGDSLYVFGGHIGRSHHHSIDNLSHHFRRLDLANPSAGWTDLGQVAGLQGMALVPHGDRVCRVGGLTAHNAADAEEEDLESLADASCFDPRSGSWSSLPPLPAGRSSHDAVVVGDVLYVVGGWQLRGAGVEPVWHDDLLSLDLASEDSVWRSVAQPFRRRALAVAAADGKVFALGGISEDGTSSRVDVYDPATETWSAGPILPMQDGLKGFGLSAFGVGDEVWLSGADGEVHALRPAENGWVLAAAHLERPRFFHRLLPHRGRLLFVGGAGRDGHLADVEVLPIPDVARIAAVPVPVDRGDWPGFRGLGEGRARLGEDEMPLHWSSEEGSAEAGIKWRQEIPGYGQSAPVVWDGQVFVTSVLGPRKETLVLTSFDLEDGGILWRRRFPTSLPLGNSDMVSRGAPTPAVDANHVYVLWESGDLVAVDHGGETLWRRSFSEEYGAFEGNHGLGSSPVLTHDAVVIQITHEGPSYLVALGKEDGEVLWKEDREPGVAWTTPVVVEGSNGQEIVASYAGRVEALDAFAGHRLWHFEGVEKNNIPSVAVDGDRVLVASSDPGHNFALRRGFGELGDEHVVWRAEGVSTGFASPILHGGCALFVNGSGVVTCVDREAGEERWKQRLSGAVWAAPVVAGERVYFFGKDGTTVVLRDDSSAAPGRGPEILAENRLEFDEPVYGVAAVRGAFLLRTGTELVRIGLGGESQAVTVNPAAAGPAGTPGAGDRRARRASR